MTKAKQSKDLRNRLTGLYLEDRTMTDSETGEIIEYQTLVAHVEFDGEHEKIDFSAKKNTGKLLRAADKHDGLFVGEDA